MGSLIFNFPMVFLMGFPHGFIIYWNRRVPWVACEVDGASWGSMGYGTGGDLQKNWKWMCLPRGNDPWNPWGYDPTGNAIYHLGDFQITGGDSNIFIFTLILGVSIPFDEPFFQLTPPSWPKMKIILSPTHQLLVNWTLNVWIVKTSRQKKGT